MSYKIQYLSISDVTEKLRISRRTLERLRINVDGVGYKFPEPDAYIGRSPRWKEDAVEEWLSNNKSIGTIDNDQDIHSTDACR